MPAPLLLSGPLAGLRKRACPRCYPDGSAAVLADAGAYEPVFTALFPLHPDGSVS